jgi:predicted Zn-dependent protease
VALLGGLAAGACTTVSPREERDIGRKEAEEVQRTVGLVDDPKVVEYVSAIGARLGQAAARPDIGWQFAVADDPAANAFALPGGWVYVTRGLLALANREDDLAAVLGHEMAHVIERHATSRVGAATPLAVLFGVPSGILSTVSPTLGGIVGGAGRVVTGLALAPYSREQEREADRVGIALSARAGWDPGALVAFLQTLERAEALAGSESKRSQFFATHPSTTGARRERRGHGSFAVARPGRRDCGEPCGVSGARRGAGRRRECHARRVRGQAVPPRRLRPRAGDARRLEDGQ